MRKVISLTSIPPRFGYLQESLQPLADQDADEVRLYIPKQYRRFPGWDGVLPRVPHGVQVHSADIDYGPATKVLPACLDLSGVDAQILFCDDDAVYPKGWAARLFRTQARRSKEAVATYARGADGNMQRRVTVAAREVRIERDVPYRALRLLHKYLGLRHPHRRPIVRAGYSEILFGVGGVVVRPEFFDDESFVIPDEVYAVDDIWLSARLARNRVCIYCPRRYPMPMPAVHASTDSLFDFTIDGLGRQTLNRKATLYCQQQFGVWLS